MQIKEIVQGEAFNEALIIKNNDGTLFIPSKDERVLFTLERNEKKILSFALIDMCIQFNTDYLLPGIYDYKIQIERSGDIIFSSRNALKIKERS